LDALPSQRRPDQHRREVIPFPATAQTQKDLILGCLDEAIAKASGDGDCRFSLRQLFYAVRPHVMEALGKAPDYNYFCQVITDYEAAKGEDIPACIATLAGCSTTPTRARRSPSAP
jgi:hypothetical protein